MLKKFKEVKSKLKKQEEENKQQILHIETVSMMTKYQLVFTKMENYLLKTSQMIFNK